MQLTHSKIAPRIVWAIAAALAVVPHTPIEAQNASAMSIREVRTVFHRRARGNATFTARLRAELVQNGVRFVSDSRGADAILDSTGQATARGFAGKVTFFDRRGCVILSQNIFRPDNSRIMRTRRQSR